MRVNFPKIYNKYFPNQLRIDLNNFNIIDIKNFLKYNKVILKPTHGGKGQGIEYFININKLVNYIFKLKKLNKCYSKKWNRKCYYVMAEIIENLKLYNKKISYQNLFFTFKY